MKKLLPVKLIRQLVGGAALTSLALASVVLVTACGTDTAPSSSQEHAERQQQADHRSGPEDDRQVARDDPALRDERRREHDMTEGYTGATEDAMLPVDLVGSPVQSRDGEEIGSIDEVLFDQEGNPVYVVLEVEQFMGVGQRLVALDWNRMSVAEDNLPGARDSTADHDTGEQRDMRTRVFTVVVDATHEELENAPEFDRQAWERELR